MLGFSRSCPKCQSRDFWLRRNPKLRALRLVCVHALRCRACHTCVWRVAPWWSKQGTTVATTR
ncbi:hypothetical protein GobsT_12430 [Gemmata obscuriglobus]|nr:hypothetical protein GobsT_12430 [Gemmata obscuriglobus]VTS01797.1 unnamed protein product [Gemmata obscuriglobus UQM 2246]